MAEDSIDLDNIEVELLIICCDVGALNQSSVFLNRRGWPTTVLTDIGQAVELIAEKRPDFILVSMSHPSPTINKLPDVISGTFNIPCIGFLETVDTMSSARFIQARLRYKIQGKPSGPSIYRTIRRIIAERLQVESEARAFDEMANVGAMGGKSDIVRISGSSGKEDSDGPSVVIQKSVAGSVSGSGSLVIKGSPQEDGDGIVATASSKMRRSLKMIESERKPGGKGTFIISGEGGSQMVVSDKATTQELLGKVKASLMSEDGPEITAMVPAEAPARDRSLLERAVEMGVNRYCKSMPDITPRPLDEATLVAVFPVDSATEPGYLVLVWQSPEMSAREEFLRGCEHEIQSVVASMNFPGKVEAGFWVELPGVDFMELSSAKAKFHFTSSHQKRVVGVAFFPTPTPIPKPKAVNDDKEMYSVKLDDISSRFPLNFKAFIRLKNNERYFMYLRNGRKILDKQKDRLKASAVDDIFLKRIDLENFRRYLATNHLSEIIIEIKRAA